MNRRQVAKLTPVDRLALKSVPMPSGCIVWTGSLNSAGYGQTSIGGVYTLVHRLAFELAHGPLAKGVQVLHSCDNRACINSDHLWSGSQFDNVQDAIAKGRMWWQAAS